MRTSCKTCKFWEAPTGLCWNGAGRYAKVIMIGDSGCSRWNPNVHRGCGGVMEARMHGNTLEHYCYGCLFTVMIDGKPIPETRDFLKKKAVSDAKACV